MTLKAKLHKQLHQPAWESEGLSPVNKLVLFLICFSVLVVIIETEKPLYWKHKEIFVGLDFTIGVLFTVEYLARVWSIGEKRRYRGILGRLRYMLTPAALVDLLVIIPFFITASSNIFVARLLRLFRLFAIAKFGRYSEASMLIWRAVWTRRHELLMSFVFTGVILLVSSTIMWAVEGDEEFDSIPRALWWGVITLTTVGYGDVYPQTVLGKICSGVTALAGIGLIAMPAGILAGAFSEAFQKHKQSVTQKRQAIKRKGQETGEHSEL